MLPLHICIHTAMSMALTRINSSSVPTGTEMNRDESAGEPVTRRSELRATFAFQGERTVMTDRYYSAPSGLADPFDLPEVEPNYACTRQTFLPESSTGITIIPSGN